MSNLNAVNISNILRVYAEGFVSPPKQDFFMRFANLLAENFTPLAIERGLRSLPRGDRFPALADIEAASRPHLQKEKVEEEKHERMYKSEEERLAMLKKHFTPMLGKDGEAKMIKKWCEIFIGESFEQDFLRLGITGVVFTKPMYFDLEKASARCKNNPSKVFDEFVKIVAESRNGRAK